MWCQIPYNERYKLINVYSLSRFRWPLDSQSKISEVFLEDRVFSQDLLVMKDLM